MKTNNSHHLDKSGNHTKFGKVNENGIIKLADFGSAKRISTATMANAKAAMDFGIEKYKSAPVRRLRIVCISDCNEGPLPRTIARCLDVDILKSLLCKWIALIATRNKNPTSCMRFKNFDITVISII